MTIIEVFRMKKLSSCILIEWRKLIKSKLSIVTACSICLVPFIVGVFATMMKYPENFKNLGLISAKMEMMRITDWSSYLMTISQVISVGGLLIFGFTASWVFGREYSDKTMIDLLALPMKRDTIVLSKFIVIALWSYILSIFALFTTLTIVLSAPVAFFACLGRGYLSPLALLFLQLFFLSLVLLLTLGNTFHGRFLHLQVVLQEKHY